MADPAGPFGFGYTGDGKYMIVRPGVQTDHIMLTNPTASPGATTGLVLDGSNWLATKTLPVSPGDVVGPAGATDEALVRFDGTTGKLLQNSLVTLSDTGNMTFNAPAVGVLSLAAGSAPGVAFTTPAGSPAPTTSQLSLYARRNSTLVTWTGPWAAPVAGAIAIERIGNIVTLGVAAFASAASISGQVITLSAALPTWAIPAAPSVTGRLRIVSGGGGGYGAWLINAAGIITISSDYSDPASPFSGAGSAGIGVVPGEVTMEYTI